MQGVWNWWPRSGVFDPRQMFPFRNRRSITITFRQDSFVVPQGGMEMVTEIRQLWPDSKVRVVAVTADAFEDRRDQCLASGFDGWLAKPFRIEDLVRIMEAVSWSVWCLKPGFQQYGRCQDCGLQASELLFALSVYAVKLRRVYQCSIGSWCWS